MNREDNELLCSVEAGTLRDEFMRRIWIPATPSSHPEANDKMAFVRSPDNISTELLQKGDALPAREPWASMPNVGKW